MNRISKADEAIAQRIRFQSIRYATCFHTRNSKTKRSRHSGPKPRKTDLGSLGPDKTTFSENEIIFDERETLKLDKLHDDAVVIQLEVYGARLSKILVNTRSSSDLFELLGQCHHYRMVGHDVADLAPVDLAVSPISLKHKETTEDQVQVGKKKGSDTKRPKGRVDGAWYSVNQRVAEWSMVVGMEGKKVVGERWLSECWSSGMVDWWETTPMAVKISLDRMKSGTGGVMVTTKTYGLSKMQIEIKDYSKNIF
ncbi:hypothetical protein YC2023_066563 [Brassica napus]